MTDMHPTPETASQELLAFTLGEQRYAIDVLAVQEIRQSSKPTPLPHVPNYILGVINLRGTILPVIDLAARLGTTSGACDARDVIVVVEVSGTVMGLIVNSVSDILTIPVCDFSPPPGIAGEGADAAIASLALHEGQMIRVLDLEAVLPELGGVAA